MIEKQNYLAYLLGVLRDGHIRIDKNKKYVHYTMEFCSNDKVWLDNIANIIEILANKRPSIRPFKKIYWRLRLRDKNFILKLKELSQFKVPQSTWFTPPFIMKSDKETKKWYISGFFDAEGCIGKGNYKYYNFDIYQSWFHDNNCPPLDDIKEMLLDFNIKSSKIKLRKNRNNLFVLRITNKESIINFCNNFQLLNSKKSELIKKIVI
ncbi:LAGLIDADG family homing endonuclease [Candidatus Woesearchaeota archaeon]|nr:LAGLIDADG family homing endonuclease [Candidatus Woesearchaeota archaeon]